MANVESHQPTLPDTSAKIVNELKSRGNFDAFRRECLADVDTRPAYQNLHQRVEGAVSSFLDKQSWMPSSNRNQLRQKLRRYLTDSRFLEVGVDRIVDQVVDRNIYTTYLPAIEALVREMLNIEAHTAVRRTVEDDAEVAVGDGPELMNPFGTWANQFHVPLSHCPAAGDSSMSISSESEPEVTLQDPHCSTPPLLAPGSRSDEERQPQTPDMRQHVSPLSDDGRPGWSSFIDQSEYRPSSVCPNSRGHKASERGSSNCSQMGQRSDPGGDGLIRTQLNTARAGEDSERMGRGARQHRLAGSLSPQSPSRRRVSEQRYSGRGEKATTFGQETRRGHSRASSSRAARDSGLYRRNSGESAASNGRHQQRHSYRPPTSAENNRRPANRRRTPPYRLLSDRRRRRSSESPPRDPLSRSDSRKHGENSNSTVSDYSYRNSKEFSRHWKSHGRSNGRGASPALSPRRSPIPTATPLVAQSRSRHPSKFSPQGSHTASNYKSSRCFTPTTPPISECRSPKSPFERACLSNTPPPRTPSPSRRSGPSFRKFDVRYSMLKHSRDVSKSRHRNSPSAPSANSVSPTVRRFSPHTPPLPSNAESTLNSGLRTSTVIGPRTPPDDTSSPEHRRLSPSDPPRDALSIPLPDGDCISGTPSRPMDSAGSTSNIPLPKSPPSSQITSHIPLPHSPPPEPSGIPLPISLAPQSPHQSTTSRARSANNVSPASLPTSLSSPFSHRQSHSPSIRSSPINSMLSSISNSSVPPSPRRRRSSRSSSRSSWSSPTLDTRTYSPSPPSAGRGGSRWRSSRRSPYHSPPFSPFSQARPSASAGRWESRRFARRTPSSRGSDSGDDRDRVGWRGRSLSRSGDDHSARRWSPFYGPPRSPTPRSPESWCPEGAVLVHGRSVSPEPWREPPSWLRSHSPQPDRYSTSWHNELPVSPPHWHPHHHRHVWRPPAPEWRRRRAVADSEHAEHRQRMQHSRRRRDDRDDSPPPPRAAPRAGGYRRGGRGFYRSSGSSANSSAANGGRQGGGVDSRRCAATLSPPFTVHIPPSLALPAPLLLSLVALCRLPAPPQSTLTAHSVCVSVC